MDVAVVVSLEPSLSRGLSMKLWISVLLLLPGPSCLRWDSVERGSGCSTKRAQLLVTLVVSADIVAVVAAPAALVSPVLPADMVPLLPLLLSISLSLSPSGSLGNSARLAGGPPVVLISPVAVVASIFDFNSFVWAPL